MKPVRLHRLAQREVREGSGYLEEQREGYGELFERAVQSCLQRIGSQPRQFPVYRELDGQTYRKCVVPRFKYPIYFTESDAGVWVATVMQGNRKPDYWIDRRPEGEAEEES